MSKKPLLSEVMREQERRAAAHALAKRVVKQSGEQSPNQAGRIIPVPAEGA